MPRTLILEPTRELAAQVEESFARYGVNHKLNVALLIGGVSFGDQETKIMRGVDVLIATPGRLLDFFERGKLLLTGIEILVIDEADRMLDMGFIPDIERICKLVPFTRQTLFFSATMPPEITRLTEPFLHNPVAHRGRARGLHRRRPSRRDSSPRRRGPAKRETLRRLHSRRRRLQERHHLLQPQARRRDRCTNRCKSTASPPAPCTATWTSARAWPRSTPSRTAKSTLIVCSDVAARGLDIPDVSHVFNFDVPTHAEDYVHRIGRTGRAGKSGVAISIVTRADQKHIAEIEKLIARKIDWIGGESIAELKDEGEAESAPDRARGAARRGERAHDERGETERRETRSGQTESGEPRRSRRRDKAEAPRPRADEPAASQAEPVAAKPPSPATDRDRRPRGRDGREERRQDNRQDDRRDRGRDEEPPVVGMGDHVPMFLLRPVKPKPAKQSPEEGDVAESTRAG